MTTRKFQLTEHAVPLVQKGEFQFQVGYEKAGPDGTLVHVNYRKCPVLKIREGDVVSTTNAWAAQLIEAMVVPNRTLRNGKSRAADRTKLFVEVGVTTKHQHDLDQNFKA